MDDHHRRSSFRAAEPGGWDPRYRMLDAWRGLACLLVVAHHAGGALRWSDAEGTGGDAWLRWLVVFAVRNMNLGVSLFFVISGYCIAASAESTSRKGGSPWAFLGRRVWRIYPPYWAAFLGFVAVVVALDAVGLGRWHLGRPGVGIESPGTLDWRQWVGNLTLTETWRPYLWGPSRDVYTSIAWSLCFEEQFYLICFLALLLAPGRFYTAMGSLTLAILAVRVWYWRADALGSLRGTFPLLWHEFAVGLAVFYRLNIARGVVQKRLVEVGLATLFLLGCLTGGHGTATASAFGLLLIVSRRWDVDWSRRRSLAFFQQSGRRCYSIYLAHLPIIVVGNRVLIELGLTGFWVRTLVMLPLVSVAGVAAGWAFHALIESRFLNPPLWPNGLGVVLRTHAGRWMLPRAARDEATSAAT